MRTIIDTHAHLCDPVFDGDMVGVLERALKSGVSGIISVAENMADVQKNLILAAEHSMIRAAAGLYPTYLDLAAGDQMCALIRRHREELAAIGEVGLDYWIIKEESQREIQREIFRGFIKLSNELDLPLNVHSRSAGRYAVSVLLESSAERVQLHAFDGKVSAAMPAADAGFFFSIPPSIVRSEQKQKLAKALPLSCLLIETDSPVLGPAPQERNEPANASVALQMIAELRGITVDEAAEAIAENTRRLYGNAIS